MVSNMDLCCWNCQSNHTKRVERSLPASSSQMEANSNFWKGLHFSALLILSSFFSCSTFSTCSFVESIPHASEKTKQQKKKLIGWKGNIELFSGPLCGPLHYWSGFLSDSARRSPLTLPRRTIFTRYSHRDGFIIRRLASHHLPSPLSRSSPLLLSPCIVFASLFLTPRTCLTRDADGHATLQRWTRVGGGAGEGPS